METSLRLRRAPRGARGATLAGLWCFGLLVAAGVLSVGSAASATTAALTLPQGFQDSVVLSGLEGPTAVRFAPDGSVFVAEQSGIVKVYDSLSDPTPTVYADLRTNVHNYADRGLLGLAVNPNYPADPSVYALYTYDAAIGGSAPRWGSSGATSDGCPTPPGPTQDGCVVSSRLSRLQRQSATPIPYATSVLADNPAAYWRLGESSGTTAADSSSNGLAGTYTGAPTLGVPGGLVGDSNIAVGFNGSSQYVQAPYASTLNASQVTVEAWAYLTGGQGTYRSVISSRDWDGSTAKGYILYAGDNDTWQFWLGGGAAGFAKVVGPAVQLNRWTHLVGTYNGTTARLYVDGLQAAEAPLAYVQNAARPLRIAAGATETTPRYLFPGRVDEVAVYGTALAASRVYAHYESGTGAPPLATETVLINDWCQQYPSESTGDLEFGPDGALYASAGVGASYSFNDWGQDGNPLNPCGDPPGGVGATLSPPTAEGGSLRGQDLRTSGDPVTLDGAVIRVDPSTGAAMPDNPLSGNSDPNARRIIAYGFRNPFRFALRPGTRQLWLGDVGGGTYEELNRLADTADSVVENFGWPCYEGTPRQVGFNAAGLNICTNLYGQAGAVTSPYFAYNHAQQVVPGEACGTGSSAVSGVAFARTSGSPYPAAYDGALFFADYARQCIWVMFEGVGGDPDPANIATFVSGGGFPVDLQIGPDGKLYWVDIGTGTVHRIDYSTSNQPPTAVATATPTSGPVPLAVAFDGSGSSDPNGDPITYSWDLNGDGVYGDSTVAKPSFTYTQAGSYTVHLRVTDSHSASTVSSPIVIAAGQSAPTATITAPSPSLTFKVGDVINFSGTATDPEDGTLPASAFSWTMTIVHCPSNCHTHPLQSFTGVKSGSFSAADHGYPSHLEIKLTVTDSSGLTDTKIVDIYPQTVDLSFASSPSGLSLVVNGVSGTTPFTQTVITNSANTVSAPTPQTVNGTTYSFSSWSDGGAASHNVTATQNMSLSATYTSGGTSGYSGAVLADSPLAYWRLGESSGSTAADASGNGRAGSYLNSPTLGAPGALSGDSNSSVGFNGTSQYVQVPYNAALNPARVSVESWVYPTGGSGAFRSVLTSRDYSASGPMARGYTLYAADNNTWQFWLGTGSAFVKLFGPAVTLNSWTHLVATYDGTTARLYVNGALAASSALAYSPNAARPLRIGAGRTETAADYFFPGRIDEVALYGTDLSAARVQAHYQAATG
jgi:glucose/arabinose dehydrogenase